MFLLEDTTQWHLWGYAVLSSAKLLINFFWKKSFRNAICLKQFGTRSGHTSGLIWVQNVCKGYQQTTLVHAQIQKVLSEGVQLWRFFCYSWWGEGGSKYHFKLAIIGPPAKCHLNGILLVCWLWPSIKGLLGSFVIFRGSRAVLSRNPTCIFLWFFRNPCTLPLWIRAC